MTPIVRPKPTPIPRSQPLPPPPMAGKEIEPIKIKVDSPLIKLLQPEGRTPTHILTLKAAPEKEKTVTPVDKQKADTAYRQAEVHAKRGRLQDAFKSLEKAYVLNPNDEKIVAALSEILTVGGQPPLAHELMSEFLERHPDSSLIRSGRINLSQTMIAYLQSMAPQVSDAERETMAKNAQTLLTMSVVDQAIIVYSEADKFRKNLAAFEKDGQKLHDEPLNKKAAVLQNIQNQAQTLLELAAHPALQGPEGAAIVKELKALGTETSDAVIRFAEADGDPIVKEQVLPLKANKALALGETDSALDLYEDYRRLECKKLGDGDAAKGLSILREKFAKAEALSKENKLELAALEVHDIPQGLLLAHDMLERAQVVKQRRASLAACRAWSHEIRVDYAKQRANASDGTWDLIWGNQTDRQKVDVAETREFNLMGEVRGRIITGKSKTILEALKDIHENSDDAELKQSAIEMMAKTGVVATFGTSPIGRLMSYASVSSPSVEDGAELISDASEFAQGDEEEKKIAASIYSVVALRSPDASQRAAAKKSLGATK